MGDTLQMAREEVETVGSGAQVREVVSDKGYHSNETVLELKEQGLRGYLSETDRGRRNWKGKNKKFQMPVYANRRRIRGRRGRRLQRRRSELVERPFAHQLTTEGLRQIFVQGHANVRKRLLIHVCGFNLGLLMRRLMGVGTPRSLQGCVLARLFSLFGAKMDRGIGRNRLWELFWTSIRLDLRFWASGLPGRVNKPFPRQIAKITIVGNIRALATGWQGSRELTLNRFM